MIRILLILLVLLVLLLLVVWAIRWVVRNKIRIGLRRFPTRGEMFTFSMILQFFKMLLRLFLRG